MQGGRGRNSNILVHERVGSKQIALYSAEISRPHEDEKGKHTIKETSENL